MLRIDNKKVSELPLNRRLKTLDLTLPAQEVSQTAWHGLFKLMS
jgi:hypothetical protein